MHRLMGKYARRAAAVALAAVIGAAGLMDGPVGTAFAATQDDVDAAREHADAIQAEKDRTDQKIQELQSKKGDAVAYVTALDQQLNSLTDEIDGLDANITAKEAEITATQKDLETAEETEKKQYSAMRLRIRYMYEKGNTSFLDLLLSSGSLAEMLNHAEYIADITRYDRQQLDNYRNVRQGYRGRQKEARG